MNTVKKTAEYAIFKRKDGRFAVKNNRNKPVNGDEKAEILSQEGLITLPKAKAPEAPAEEAEATTEGE